MIPRSECQRDHKAAASRRNWIAALSVVMLMAVCSPLHADVDFFVDFDNTVLNQTQREQILNDTRADYSFNTRIRFTTIRPTTGTYEAITLTPGIGSYTRGSGTSVRTRYRWGHARLRSVWVGNFTIRHSTVFGSSSSLVNAVGDTLSHEIDHIIRGGGHNSGDPSDLNNRGGEVPPTMRATLKRSFNSTDKSIKSTRIDSGDMAIPSGQDCEYGEDHLVSFIFGHPEDLPGDVDDVTVSVRFQSLQPPGPFEIGIVEPDGRFFPYIFEGNMEGEGTFQPDIPTLFAVRDTETALVYDACHNGLVTLGPPVFPPELSWVPTVYEPYADSAEIFIDASSMGGPVVAFTINTYFEGEGLQHPAPPAAVPTIGTIAMFVLLLALLSAMVVKLRHSVEA